MDSSGKVVYSDKENTVFGLEGAITSVKLGREKYYMSTYYISGINVILDENKRP